MKRVLQKVFEMLGVSGDNRLPDQTDLAAVQIAAKEMSLSPAYRDTVIVVVELGSEFSIEAGGYVRRQYLFYPFREAADYNRIVCLMAAYRNGRRLDTIDAIEATSQVTSKETDFDETAPAATLVWGKPGRWAVRRDEQHSLTQS